MFDRRTVHWAGTRAIAFGAALVVLSLPLVIVGVADVLADAASITTAIDVLIHLAPVEAVHRDSWTPLSLGLLGVGIGCWSLGVGFLLQGRTEG
ncbi:hypothetical protein ZOD2009_07659 [Haladaptatus paucihalophilus DX253]|uniref:Uncharacterized protein n=1 Tax=Haladaptatus paucihalophilus DX253 TaxID=797209 RepID=E7QRV9_HALPU|nr:MULTISPECIES: hypothetical protein [Haladaptatus]EFW92728.1 hypothetical protein ZOD2009_07659 [Haladaptatus paucihalophilus DX253]GKZ13674.1 hypothetical protein HAL_15550 [Haladaptatus sp. T7]SHK14342.1 hypothetical protein SAMN05444342_0729 [Haladaptatus paucihalophilus DX253]